MNCWICNSPAETREHIIKQSDIRRLFGCGPYPKGNRLKRINVNRRKRLIQSEDSDHIKYQKGLCQKCNSSRSQPWDFAYDQFMEYFISHESELKQTRKIDFKDIAQIKTGEFSKNLYSYFIKSFGCQLQESKQDLPLELSEYLLRKRNYTNLTISFAIDESRPQKKQFPVIQVHNLEGKVDNLLNMPLSYNWAVSIGWISFAFCYNREPLLSLGSPFCGDAGIFNVGILKM